MKKSFILILVLALILFTSACSTSTTNSPQLTTGKDEAAETTATPTAATSQTDGATAFTETNTESLFKKGDLVLFGRYYSESILWEIMKVESGKLTLWSKHILTSKCFDAAESGVYYSGQSDADRFGSNNWQDSNIRDWLNARGSVSWTTQPPTEEAVYGKGYYDDEAGFLAGFSEADYQMILLEERQLLDFDGNTLYTTTDRVFLASMTEVKVDGKWGLSQANLTKIPTEAAVAHNLNTYPDERLACMYFLQTPGSDDQFQVYGVFDDGRFWVGDACVSTHGIAPALVISLKEPVSGSGTLTDPWILN